MNKKCNGEGQRFLVRVAAILLALAGAGSAYGGSMVAGPYPGAVPDRNAGNVTVRVYLSHAPLAKVAGWYAGKLGDLNKDAGNTLWNADGEAQSAGAPLGETNPQVEVRRLGRVTMGQAMVARSLKDMTLARDVGVFCEGIQRELASKEKAGGTDSMAVAGADKTKQKLAQFQQQIQRLNQQLQAQTTPQDRAIAKMSELFEGLRNEAFGGSHGHTKAQLLAVYAKYKYLETAWYPTVKTAQGPESYDRWLLARKWAELKAERQKVSTPAAKSGADMSALAARIQAAAAAGRMDEVQALSGQMQRAMQGGQAANARAGQVVLKDHWSYWLAFFKKLASKAYRTRIWVNTSPQKWGY